MHVLRVFRISWAVTNLKIETTHAQLVNLQLLSWKEKRLLSLLLSRNNQI